MKNKSNHINNVKSKYQKFFYYFDTLSIVIIICFFLVYSILSLPSLIKYHFILYFFGVLFSIEYVLRCVCAIDKKKYMCSILGVLDLISILVVFLPILSPVRALRLLKILRLLNYLDSNHNNTLTKLLKALDEIKGLLLGYFIFSLILIYVSSVVIFYFENEAQPETFASIFHTLWWCIITLTTVGYGDMAPVTFGGRVFTGCLLFIGIGVIAVPTALISSSLMQVNEEGSRDSLKN